MHVGLIIIFGYWMLGQQNYSPDGNDSNVNKNYGIYFNLAVEGEGEEMNLMIPDIPDILNEQSSQLL